EIFAAVSNEVARGPDVVKMLHEPWCRAGAVCRNGAWHFGNSINVVCHSFEKLNNVRLAFTFKHTVDGTLAMCQNGLRDEGSAVATNANERTRQHNFRRDGQIDNLGNISKVVTRKSDKVRKPLR